MSEIQEGIVKMVVDITTKQITKKLILQLLEENPDIYYIGFYKKCRECGIHLRERHTT